MLREFAPGDRVRYCHFGEWRNATLTELLYDGAVARVETDNGGVSYVRVTSLSEPVDE